MSKTKKKEAMDLLPNDLFEKLEKEIGMKESTMEVFQNFPQYSLKGDKDPRWKQVHYRIFKKGKCFLVVFYNDDLIHSFNLYGKEKQIPSGLTRLIWNIKTHNDMDPDGEY